MSSSVKIHLTFKSDITEQQIKEYDKRYWAFAVPVEGKE